MKDKLIFTNNLINTIKGRINTTKFSSKREEYERKIIKIFEDKDFKYMGNEYFEGGSWHWHEGKEEEKDSFFYTRTIGNFKGTIDYSHVPSICSYFTFNEHFLSKLKRMTKFISESSYLEVLVYNLIKESTGEEFKVSYDKGVVFAKYFFPIGKINFELFLDSYNRKEPFETKETTLYQEWNVEVLTTDYNKFYNRK